MLRWKAEVSRKLVEAAEEGVDDGDGERWPETRGG